MLAGLLPSLRSTIPARLELDTLDGINRGLLAFLSLAQSGGLTAFDLAQRKRHGTLVNFATPGWGVSPFGRILTFDGVNDYINTNGRWINNLSTGTFAIRIRPNAGGGVAYYEDGGGFNNFAFFNPTTGSSALEFNIGSGTTRNSTTRTWVSSTWYDIVCTWGTDIRIYVNGVLDTTIAVSGGTASASGDNDQVGRYSFGGGISGLYSPASIGPIRIYSRALTYAEIQRLFRDPYAGTLDPADRLFFAVRSAALPALTATMSATVDITGGLTAALAPLTTGAGPSRTRRGARRIYLPEPQASAVFHPNALPDDLAAHAVKAWQDDEDDETWFLLA